MNRIWGILSLALLLAGCSAYKEVVYLQDVTDGDETPMGKVQEITIQPSDILSISVNAAESEKELVQPFNIIPILPNNYTSGSVAATPLHGYVVDPDGCINFPTFGKIHVAGMTRNELINFLSSKLVSEGQLTRPIVAVSFLNLKVNVMGEVAHPGSYAITSNKMTLLDALSMAGDLTIYGRRDKVLVIREEDGKRINAYVNLFDRLQATLTDLKTLILEHGARLSAIDVDRVVIKVHDDRWMICFVNNKAVLYHNNYSVLDNYQRLFNVGYHVQNDGGIHTFHNFTRMMLSYSWAEHVELLKAKALAELQEKLRKRLESTPNWLHVPRFSLFNTYYTVLDCNHRLGRFLRKNGVPFIAVDKTYEAGSPYRLVTCRIRRWQKAKFIAAVAALKEYTVTAGYHDYADQCDQRIQGQSESYQVNLQLKPSSVA